MTPRALLVAVIVALTGCGGGGDEHSDFRAATDCLANRGNLEVTTTDVAATEHNIDYIAMAASEGGAEVEFTGTGRCSLSSATAAMPRTRWTRTASSMATMAS